MQSPPIMPQHQTAAQVAFVGIGNTLAGDDGAGVIALERLRTALAGCVNEQMLFYTLPGDLYAISEILDVAERFVFLDALAGETPGELRTLRSDAPFTHAGSFHQTDIGAVMRTLAALEYRVPFPAWEIRGITIVPPERLEEGLSPEINRAVDRLVGVVVEEIRGDTVMHRR
jgi:hydrogenase maturation protease